MHGYPETIVIRHLMARPARSQREGRPTSAPAGASLAVVVLVTAFLLIVGLGFAVTALVPGNDATPQAGCAVEVAGHAECR